MSGISTHILDAALGIPAAQVLVQLWQRQQGQYVLIAQHLSDGDGRVKDFQLEAFSCADYQLQFYVGDYFAQAQRACFYPKVCIDFSVTDASQHYHVPLLISPFAYSTYRGS
jgi:5-hydroxyisourate hydrolase